MVELEEEKITPERSSAASSGSLKAALTKLPGVLTKLGFAGLRTGQDKAIYNLFYGLDTILLLPTGSGKSAVYIIPTLCLGYKTLIFSPLIALMKDQVESLWRLGCKAGVINSAQSPAENAMTVSEWESGALSFLFVAPERLQDAKFIELMNRIPPDLITVDESHLISTWSDSFRPDYVKIGDLIKSIKPKSVLALTATATPEVEEDIRRVMNIQSADKVLYLPPRLNLKLHSEDLRNDMQIFRALTSVEGQSICYCATVKRANELHASFGDAIKGGALCYTGKMTPSERDAAQDSFMSGHTRVMFATNAFGLGINKSDIRGIVHADAPGSLDALSQECIHTASSISTPSGFRLAKDIQVGDMVDTKNGSKPVLRIIKGSTKKWLRIRTSSGSELCLTPNHPVFVGDEVVEAKNLKLKDKLFFDRRFVILETQYDLLNIYSDIDAYVAICPALLQQCRDTLGLDELQKILGMARKHDWTILKRRRGGLLKRFITMAEAAGLHLRHQDIMAFTGSAAKKLSLPLEFDANLGWLLGMIATDGNMKTGRGFGKDNASHVIRLAITNIDIAKKFETILKSYGLSVSFVTTKASSNKTVHGKKDVHTVAAHSKLLMKLVNHFGIPTGKKTYTCDCPNWLTHLPEEFRAGYIAGVFDANGSFGLTHLIERDGLFAGRFRVHSASWKFISGISRMLQTFDINMSIYKSDYTSNAHIMKCLAGHGYDGSIQDQQSVSNFYNLIWVKYGCKGMPADFSKHAPHSRPNSSSTPILEIDEFDVQDEETINFSVADDNEFFVDSIRTHNCGRAGRDGNDSWCNSFFHESAYATQMFFINTKYPERAIVERVYSYMRRVANKDGVVKKTVEDVANGVGGKNDGVGAALSILASFKVLDRTSDSDSLTTVKFIQPHLQEEYAKFVPAIEKLGFKNADGGFEFEVSMLMDELGLKSKKLTDTLKLLADNNYIEYTRPFRGKISKFIGDLSLVDFDYLKRRRALSIAKLNALFDYHRVPDEDKHEYIADYFKGEIVTKEDYT